MDIDILKVISPYPFINDGVLIETRQVAQNKTCLSCKKKDCLDFNSYKNGHYRCYKHFDNKLIALSGEKIVFNGLVFSDNNEIPQGRKEARKAHLHSRADIENKIIELNSIADYINKGITESIREKFSLFHDVKTSYGLAFSNIESYILKMHGDTFNEKLQSCDQEIVDLYDSLDLVNSLLELIDVIVNPKAITQGTRRTINLYRLIDKLTKLFINKAQKKNLTIKVSSSYQVPNGEYHDSIKLVPIILLENAIKYSDPNTEINVKFTNKENRIQFCVSSSGKLILSDERVSIFNRHTRGVNADHYTDKGIGMGLYIANMILNHHNGTITCHTIASSNSDKGVNTFEVML